MGTLNRLTAVFVLKVKKPRLYPDGGGLYLQVSESKITKNITKSWIFRFKGRDMGLGSADVITLADARERAHVARKLVAEGKDPIILRNEARAEFESAVAAAKNKLVTFHNAAEKCIDLRKGKWKNSKHEDQWRNTI